MRGSKDPLVCSSKTHLRALSKEPPYIGTKPLLLLLLKVLMQLILMQLLQMVAVLLLPI